MQRATIAGRSAAVLDAVIERYIATGDPVGSAAIPSMLTERVSPATVRNVMAELEHLGYLEQPHTSAGRSPTRRGYRRYVEGLCAEGRYDSVDPRPLREALQDESSEVQELLRRTCKLLAELSDLVGVVSAPPMADTVFQHIDFVPLDGGRILAIIVARGGHTKSRVVSVRRPMSTEKLDRAAQYLVRRFAGRSLRKVACRIAALLAEANERLDQYERQAMSLGARSLPSDMDEAEVIVEGSSSLVTRREFEAREDLQAVLETIDHPNELFAALQQDGVSTTPRVLIGARPLPAALGGCSLITATYASAGTVLGSVAVLGPTRLPYARAIALVEAVAAATSVLVERLGV